jgi:hypothetical protein
MPYNGVGQFTSLGAPVFPAVSNTFILASSFNATLNDIFSGLSTALPRDGQAAMAANLPMGNFRITGLANGTGGQDAVTFGQVFNGASFANASLTGNINGAGATSITVPTATPLDSSSNAASTAFVQGAAFNTALPAQAGQAGKFVKTDGVSASWQPAYPLTTDIPHGSALTVDSSGDVEWGMGTPQFLFNNLGVI